MAVVQNKLASEVGILLLDRSIYVRLSINRFKMFKPGKSEVLKQKHQNLPQISSRSMRGKERCEHLVAPRIEHLLEEAQDSIL